MPFNAETMTDEGQTMTRVSKPAYRDGIIDEDNLHAVLGHCVMWRINDISAACIDVFF